MDKTFNPQAAEAHWREFWEKNDVFTPNKTSDNKFCIILPPPNVTGALHMGHAFQDTLMDILVRHRRMQGDDVHWQLGTDHAGIATQMVVERQLNQTGQSRHDLGREKFVNKIWDWKAQSGGTIESQMMRLGVSGDRKDSKFTLDDDVSDAVTQVFEQLYDEGLIYRGERLVNWDPTLQTAVSDLEVISEETTGHLWHLRYHLVDNPDAYLVVATTRPETLLGDVAVAVHPDDQRYQHLIGQQCRIPLIDRAIPIIADDTVLMDFGTGCVKITPAHDFNDNAMGQRHQLPLINILKPDGTLNDTAPEQYRGLTVQDARQRIVSDCQDSQVLDQVEDITHTVPRCDRTGAIIEPFMTPQWFVKIAPLAEPALKAVKDGDVQFVPKTWENTYFDWMNNIQDWCISRQLWWGHRIPAWYDNEGNIYVARDIDHLKEKYQLTNVAHLTQDNDVLDTWFSSALWPMTALGWPQNSQKLQDYYPTDVLVTGFDIIFFWVARMIMFGLKFKHEVPFHTVYVHGLIQDAQGQKMSKSKGNVIDPLDLIDGIDLDTLLDKRTQGLMQPAMKNKIKQLTSRQFPQGIPAFGTDALRMAFATLASPTRHLRFDLDKVSAQKLFCNKLWNAARYLLQATDAEHVYEEQLAGQAHPINAWICDTFNQVQAQAHQHLKAYRFDLAASAWYEFTWHIFCDWYLEFSKTLRENADYQQATEATLIWIMERLCRELHPFMPFITEDIWHHLKPRLAHQDALSVSQCKSQPLPTPAKTNPQPVTHLIELITTIRTLRSDLNIPASQCVDIYTDSAPCDWTLFEAQIKHLAKVNQIHWSTTQAPLGFSAFSAQSQWTLPLSDDLDLEAESHKLTKSIEDLNKEISQLEKKLSNPQYCEKAPASVVEKTKQAKDNAAHKKAATEKQLSFILAALKG